MVTPREIVRAARARREEISAILYAENVSQLSCSTVVGKQMDFMFVKQEQCSATANCASVQLHSHPANRHSEPPRGVSIILQKTSACREILYIWTTSLVTSRRLANRIKPSPVTVPTCRNMHYRRQRNCWIHIREQTHRPYDKIVRHEFCELVNSWRVCYTNRTPHSFYLAKKPSLFSVDMWNLRIKVSGLQKIPCISMKCH